MAGRQTNRALATSNLSVVEPETQWQCDLLDRTRPRTPAYALLPITSLPDQPIAIAGRILPST